MKKLSFCLITIWTILSTSCSQKEVDVLPKYDKRNINWDLLEEVKHLPTVEAQRLAFKGVLNADEMYCLFSEKLDFFLENINYNESQVKLIKNLLDSFSPTSYSDDAQEQKFRESFTNDWIKKARREFEETDLIALVGYLSVPNQLYKKSNGRIAGTLNQWILPDYGGGSVPSGGNNGDRVSGCSCSRWADFCLGAMSCGVSYCYRSAHGCGLLWINTCDGGCRL